MAFENPDVDDFKYFFMRDFPYGDDEAGFEFVLAADIQKGIDAAAAFINQALYPTQEQYNIGFLNLAAHYMVMSLRASSQGVAGKVNWMEVGKTVGSVSQSFQIPQRIMDNPSYAILCQTSYGLMFLQNILPKLVGQMFIVCGWTKS